MGWRDEAACLTVASEVMFADGRRGPHAWDEARAVCKSCPVLVECRAEEMAHEGNWPVTWRYGMRGGLGPSERRELAGWFEVERSWREWQLGRDRVVLHREEWPMEVAG